ncbi:VPS9 domain containing 1 [Chamberlinius hualienensis]
MFHSEHYGSKQALKLVDEALQSDSRNENEVAYSKYLESVSAIAVTLLTNRTMGSNNRFSPQQRKKLIVTAQQCLDRISCLSELLNDKVSVVDEVTKISSGSEPFDKTMETSNCDTLVDVPSLTTQSCDCPSKSVSVLETIDWVSTEEPMDRHNIIEDSSPLEKAKRLNATLMTKYEARMTKCTQANSKINIALELHRRMAENLKIAREQERTYTQNMQDKQRQRFQEAVKKMSLSALKRCTDSELKMKAELYIKIMQYGEKKKWVGDLKKRLRDNPDDVDLVEMVVRTTLRDLEHPISKWLAKKTKYMCDRMKYLISSADRQPQSVSVKIPVDESRLESTQNIVDSVDHQRHRKSRNSFFDTFIENKDEVEVAMEIGEELTSQLKETVKQQNSFTQASVRFMKRLRNKPIPEIDDDPTYTYESIGEELEKLTNEILQVLSDVMELFVLTHDQLQQKSNFEKCSLTVEKMFYPDVWNLLSNICQIVHKDEIVSIDRAMMQMTNITPAELDYKLEVCALTTEKQSKEVIQLLQHMIELSVPYEKLQVLVHTIKILCGSCQQSTDDDKTSSMGADDLIPLLSYICIRSRLAVLLSECYLLERFISQRNLMGEEGYCLTSLQTAIKYIQSCDHEIEADVDPKETSV